MNNARIQAGDSVLCRPVCRWNTRKTWRTIVRVDWTRSMAPFAVRYNDCDEFWLRPSEIFEIKH